jgi:hypothetical protein
MAAAAPRPRVPAAKCHGYRLSLGDMAAAFGRPRRVLFAAALLACSCVRNSAPELVGKWSTRETAPDGVHGTSATYDFRANGTFEMTGYPPIEVKGKWRVLERSPGKLRLELREQEMSVMGRNKSRWNDEDAWGELSPDGRTFTYKGKVLRKDETSR